MLIYKLDLIGHVHNHPTRTIQENYSFPLGRDEDYIDELIDQFATAFTLISIKTEPDRAHVVQRQETRISNV